MKTVLANKGLLINNIITYRAVYLVPFLCYVNDMPIIVKCMLLLYADDSALIVSDFDSKEIVD